MGVKPDGPDIAEPVIEDGRKDRTVTVPEKAHDQPGEESQKGEGGVGGGEMGEAEKGRRDENCPGGREFRREDRLQPPPEKGLLRHGHGKAGEDGRADRPGPRRGKVIPKKQKGNGRQGEERPRRGKGKVSPPPAGDLPPQAAALKGPFPEGAPPVGKIKKKGEDE